MGDSDIPFLFMVGWWFYPSWKIMKVNGKGNGYIISYIVENKNVPNHQSDRLMAYLWHIHGIFSWDMLIIIKIGLPSGKLT